MLPGRGLGGGQAEDGSFLWADLQVVAGIDGTGRQRDEAEVALFDALQEDDRPEGRTFNAEKPVLGFEPRQAVREFEDIFFRELHDAELFSAD